MIGLEPFRQTLVGRHLKEGARGAGEPATLTVWSTRPVLVPGLGRSIAVQGELSAGGLCNRCPVQGRVTFDRWAPLAVSYDLELSLADGTACRLHGRRRRDLAGLLAAASTVRADLLDAGGRRLSELELRLDYRKAIAEKLW